MHAASRRTCSARLRAGASVHGLRPLDAAACTQYHGTGQRRLATPHGTGADGSMTAVGRGASTRLGEGGGATYSSEERLPLGRVGVGPAVRQQDGVVRRARHAVLEELERALDAVVPTVVRLELPLHLLVEEALVALRARATDAIWPEMYVAKAISPTSRSLGCARTRTCVHECQGVEGVGGWE